MKKRCARLFCLLFAVYIGTAVANAPSIFQFDDTQKQALLDELFFEVRCLVCQNQNLKDSKADLAMDLKKIVHEQVGAGKKKEDIIVFLKARYGDFVHYEPPKDERTWLLWMMPWLWLLTGLLLWFFWAGRQSKMSNQKQ